MSRAVLDIRLENGDEIETEAYVDVSGEDVSLYIAIGDPLTSRTRLYIYGASAEQIIHFGRQVVEQAELAQSQIAASREAVLV